MHFQLDRNGAFIAEEDQRFVWMIPYLNGVSVSASERARLKDYLNTTLTSVGLKKPLQAWNGSRLLKLLNTSWEQTSSPSLCYLLEGLSAFHYQKIMSVVG